MFLFVAETLRNRVMGKLRSEYMIVIMLVKPQREIV